MFNPIFKGTVQGGNIQEGAHLQIHKILNISDNDHEEIEIYQ